MLNDFKAFIMRGNVIDMAAVIIIGVAFGAIATSMVNDVIMPPIGLALGNLDFSDLMIVLKEGSAPAHYESLAATRDAGAVTLNYGAFINTLVIFLIISLVVFFFIVRPINKLADRNR